MSNLSESLVGCPGTVLWLSDSFVWLKLSCCARTLSWSDGTLIFARSLPSLCDNRIRLLSALVNARIHPKRWISRKLLGLLLTSVFSYSVLCLPWRLGFSWKRSNVLTVRSFVARKSLALDARASRRAQAHCGRWLSFVERSLGSWDAQGFFLGRTPMNFSESYLGLSKWQRFLFALLEQAEVQCSRCLGKKFHLQFPGSYANLKTGPFAALY